MKSTLFLLLATTGSYLMQAQDPFTSTFRACVANDGTFGDRTCYLSAGTYDVSSAYKLVVSRSNTTIEGSIIYSRSDVTIRRSQAAIYPLIQVTGSNVKIKNLKIDGRRSLLGLASIPGVQRNSYIDVEAGTAYNFTFEADLTGSVGFGINGPGALTPNDSYSGYLNVVNSAFSYIGMAGARSYNNGYFFNNTFDSIAAGAVELRGRSSSMLSSIFTRNHREFPFGDDGGQLVIQQCARNVTVSNNAFTGYYEGATISKSASGIEVYGSNVQISSNSISQHSGGGLNIDRIPDNSDSGCTDAMYSGSGITLNSNNIEYNLRSGVAINSNTGSNNTNYTSNIAFYYGNFNFNGYYINGTPSNFSSAFGINVQNLSSPHPVIFVNSSFNGNRTSKCQNILFGTCYP